MHERLSLSSFGARQELFDLMNCGCFDSAIITEKDLKGGSENQRPKQYKFFYCPFQYFLQVEIPIEVDAPGAKEGGDTDNTASASDSNAIVSDSTSTGSTEDSTEPLWFAVLSAIVGALARLFSFIGSLIDMVVAAPSASNDGIRVKGHNGEIKSLAMQKAALHAQRLDRDVARSPQQALIDETFSEIAPSLVSLRSTDSQVHVGSMSVAERRTQIY